MKDDTPRTPTTNHDDLPPPLRIRNRKRRRTDTNTDTSSTDNPKKPKPADVKSTHVEDAMEQDPPAESALEQLQDEYDQHATLLNDAKRRVKNLEEVIEIFGQYALGKKRLTEALEQWIGIQEDEMISKGCAMDDIAEGFGYYLRAAEIFNNAAEQQFKEIEIEPDGDQNKPEDTVGRDAD